MNTNPIGFDPKDGILYSSSVGIASLDSMFQALNALASNKLLPRNLRILEDGRGSQVNFPPKDIPALVSCMEKVLLEYNSIRHAVIHNDPTTTAFAFLLDHYMKNEKYTFKVFITFEAARRWVLL